MVVAEQFQISVETALTVVIVTVSMYFAFIALVRVLGQHTLTSMSSIAFGAVLGRTVLLAEPTLMIGLVALATLFVLQGLLGLFRQTPIFDRLLHRAPVLLVADGVLLRDNMRRVHVVEDEIRQAVRRAGARRLQDVRCVVLERNGAVSVVASQAPVDPWLLEGVDGGPSRSTRA